LRLKALKKLGAFLEQRHFDVIIANMYKPINLLMQLRRSVSASLCIGIIHAFGEFDRLARRLMMRWMLDSRWRIVGVSQPLRDYLIRANCGLDGNNTFVINNAIDVKLLVNQAMNSVDARAALKLPAQGLVFGTVGRCVQGKRQLELLQAFHQFVGRRQDVFLVIIGDGELYAELVAYVAAHQLQHKVYLTGYVPQALNYLRALDVFVFPSETEGFGIALLEAMAMSLPTIVNDVEPLKSIVVDGGVAVDSADIAVLAQAMENYYHLSAAELKQKGIANYERVCTHYDIETYRTAYRDLVESHFSENLVH
jgi:glycosyltransferase involved in cell wall biosynthesis